MRLKVYSPAGVVLSKEIQKVDFEALDGHFTLLPRHVDFITALPPNIVQYQTEDERIHYMACNRGILVKQGSEVVLSVRKAVLNDDLKQLSRAIEIEFKQDDEERKEVDLVMARLELGLSRSFMKLRQGDEVNA